MSVDGSQRPGPRGDIPPEEREALKRRSTDIGARLDEARRRSEPKQGGPQGATTGRALRASAELIGGLVVGGAIGWYLDGWLGNKKPIFFILFFLLGATAGILNVVRSAMREKTPPAPSVQDDADDDR